MALDFPLGPVVGQQYPFTPVPGQPVYIWDGEKWVGAPSGDTFTDAPNDGAQYARQSLAWAKVAAAPFDAMSYSGMQINGGMEVSQELGVGNFRTTSGYACDGWSLFLVGTMVVACGSFVTGAIPGFSNWLYANVPTAQSALGVNDEALLYTNIEGYRVARLAWGTANAKPITLAFWSTHHRTGIYTGVIRNSAANRSYAFSYTHNAVGTPQYNVITIPGDTAGTWLKTNGIGMTIMFAMAAGTTPTAPSLNTWLAGNYVAGPGQVNAVAATSDIFVITGVVVLPGTQAPTAAQSPFVMRPYDQELLTCQRYFQVIEGLAAITSLPGRYPSWPYLAPMRTIPTTILSGFSGFGMAFAPTKTGFSQSAPNNVDTIFTIALDARL